MPGSWELVDLRRNRVLVVVISPPEQKVSRAWAKMLRTLQLPPLSDFMDVTGLPFGPARNFGLKNALDNGHGWLFFLDSDVIVPDNCVPRMLETGRDLSCALYHQRFPPYMPAAFMRGLTPDGKITKTPLPPFNYGDIIPCDFIPTGAMLISRRCLEAVAARYPKPFEWTVDIDNPTGGLSEDYTFCLNAASLGFQPYLNTSIQARHEVSMAATVRGVEP